MTALAARRELDRAAEAASRRHQTALAVSHFRLMVLMLLFAGATFLIGGRLAWLSVFADRPQAGGGGAAAGDRADMVDRNGVPLASTIRAWSIAVSPVRILGDRNVIAARLAALMPERTELEYRRILFSGRKFVYLRRRAMPELVEAVNAIGDPGLIPGREPERLYPQAALAGHVLGYLDRDGVAVSGMERVLDQHLAGPTAKGAPVELSIDTRVQAALETELGQAMAKFTAAGASGIVLDVATGEVLALASLPSFNANAPGRDVANVANKATYFTYELGSTFKILTVANAIESGVVHDMAQRYDATGKLQVGGFRISDDHPKNRALTIPEIIVYSSNIGTARMADELGRDRTMSFFHKLGLDAPADIELAERGKPQLPRYWARTTTMTVAYGHGIAVTPLHLASAYAALANGGIWRPATLLKRDPGHVPAGRRVISEATSARIRQLMRLVVLQGTGGNADAPGLRVGGKTGTAEKASNGGYARKSLVTTFAGVFPMDRPRYVVLAMLDEPHATKDTYGYATAGWTAAPIVRKVVARIGPLLGVMPDESRDIDVSDLMPLIAERREPGKNAVE